MRKRINRALLATTAAGVSITTLGFIAMSSSASAAPRYFSPSGGTPIATDANCTTGTSPADDCAMSGYQASGRDFRYAQALINVPDVNLTSTTDEGFAPIYVALDNSSNTDYQYTRVGIAPCPVGKASWHLVPGDTATDCTTLTGNTDGWVAFAATADTGVSPTITIHVIAVSTGGDGVFASAYLTPTGNSVHTVITLPSGTTYNNTFAITGPVYTQAMAVEDWTTNIENTDTAPMPNAPGVGGTAGTSGTKYRDVQFFQGRFTTESGSAGTFNGPWTLNALEATSNGDLPATGTLIGQPSYLWNDGSGYQGKGSDAFGLWRYPF